MDIYGILIYSLSDYNNPVKVSGFRSNGNNYGEIYGVDVSKDDKIIVTVIKYTKLSIHNIEDLNLPYF